MSQFNLKIVITAEYPDRSTYQQAPPLNMTRPLLQQHLQPMYRSPMGRTPTSQSPRAVAARFRRQLDRHSILTNSATDSASEDGEHMAMTSRYVAPPPPRGGGVYVPVVEVVARVQPLSEERPLPRASTSDAYTQQMYEEDEQKLCEEFNQMPQRTVTPLIDMPEDTSDIPTEISIDEVSYVTWSPEA